MRKRLENHINVRRIQAKYKRSSRKKKWQILDEISDLSGMSRKSVIRILDRRLRRDNKYPGPKPTYDSEQILSPLKSFWFASDQMCSKKLKVAISHGLPFYEKEHGELDVSIRKQLLNISAATIDRLLKPIKAKTKRKGLGGTKPGRLLKNQIPIKTNHWDDNEPGFLEADTVGHCGNSFEGNFIWSITFTDIHTTWTENRAVWNKGAAGVVDQVKDAEGTLPSKIKGFDSDNGSEFLNYHCKIFIDVLQGKLDPIPASCPQELSTVIDQCRAIAPDERPDAEGLMKSLAGLKELSLFAAKPEVPGSQFSGAFESPSASRG